MAIADPQPGPGAPASGQDAQRERGHVRQVYDAIAAEYDERMAGQGVLDQMFTDTESDFLLGKIRPADEVLDMGCGTGRFTVPLAERAARSPAWISPRECLRSRAVSSPVEG